MQPDPGVHAQRGGVRARLQRLSGHLPGRGARGCFIPPGAPPPGLLRGRARGAPGRAALAGHQGERRLQLRRGSPVMPAVWGGSFPCIALPLLLWRQCPSICPAQLCSGQCCGPADIHRTHQSCTAHIKSGKTLNVALRRQPVARQVCRPRLSCHGRHKNSQSFQTSGLTAHHPLVTLGAPCLLQWSRA